MKTHFINTTTRLACIAGFALTASMANAATISTDFESAIAPAVPSGWTTVGVGANGTFATTAAEGNPGQSGNLDWTGTNQTAPTVYLVNSGVAFDATQSITGSFQFYNEDDGFDTTSNFIIGDVQNGLTNTSAGEFLNVSLAERTFGRRANIYDGANTKVFNGDGSNTYRIDDNNWISANFTWSPTSGRTGDFSISWVQSAVDTSPKGPMTVTGYTFDSNEVFFGFGTGRSPVRFDNISITGTAVPELSAALLGGLGLLAFLRRRRL